MLAHNASVNCEVPQMNTRCMASFAMMLSRSRPAVTAYLPITSAAHRVLIRRTAGHAMLRQPWVVDAHDERQPLLVGDLGKPGTDQSSHAKLVAGSADIR